TVPATASGAGVAGLIVSRTSEARERDARRLDIIYQQLQDALNRFGTEQQEIAKAVEELKELLDIDNYNGDPPRARLAASSSEVAGVTTPGASSAGAATSAFVAGGAAPAASGAAGTTSSTGRGTGTRACPISVDLETGTIRTMNKSTSGFSLH
ncbi:unnamed protein product, partial [Amoebophrya sp. A120]